MTSAIDVTKPTTGNPTTESVRQNFAAAKDEIEELQAAVGIGGARIEYEEPPGGGPDAIPENALANPLSAGRYLIKISTGHVGSVTVHGAGEYEFSQSITNLVGENSLAVRAFRLDATGFNVQNRTLNLTTGVMTYVLAHITRIKKVSL